LEAVSNYIMVETLAPILRPKTTTTGGSAGGKQRTSADAIIRRDQEDKAMYAHTKDDDDASTKFRSSQRGLDSPSMQLACELMFSLKQNKNLFESPRYWSFSETWRKLGPSIRKATYYHYPSNHPVDYARIGRYRRWVDHLIGFYTAQRLRRSQAYPAQSDSVRTILQVIQKRIQDPRNNDPVRILVMGGSVTTGRDCEINPLRLPTSRKFGGTQNWCAYASRLEGLLNSVLFPSWRPKSGVRVRNGRYDGSTTSSTTAAAASDDPIKMDSNEEDEDYFPIFEVTNVAQQATNSQVGAMTLEHWLLPFLEYEPPHVVISSYSANDAHDDESMAFEVNQQDWLRAARNLRPCDDYLPLVVLADDVFSHGAFLQRALAQTGSIYKTASWYDAMAITYSNVVRQASDYAANFSRSDGHPLFGSGLKSGNHPGMGFHIGHALTLFFNLAEALHAGCVNPHDPIGSVAITEELDETADVTNGGTEVESTSKKTEEMTFRPLAAPRTKYRGRYRPNAGLVLKDWAANEAIQDRRCGDGNQFANATSATRANVVRQRPPYSTRTCVYAWMVNPMTPVWTVTDVTKAVEHVLTRNDGWTADNQHKVGWYTNSSLSSSGKKSVSQSFFSIELRNISMSADYITVLSLKSYGPEWEGSRIRIDVAVQSPGRGRPPLRTTRYFVNGHHDKRISVSYPHRFRLPSAEAAGDSGAKAGDTIRVRFTNVGGTQFKMSGLAICELAMSE
jgi:hypothetical protein